LERQFLGQPCNQLDMVATNDADQSAIALDSTGSPFVAWRETGNIYVKYWDGTAWVSFGAELDTTLSEAAETPVIAVNSSDNPIVAWSEFNTANTNRDIYVKRWDGTAWIALGSALDTAANEDALAPSLVLDASGNPLVAWQGSNNIYVKRWDGTAWVSLGTALDFRLNNIAATPNIGINASGVPFVAWSEVVNGNTNAYAKRWDGSTWVQLGGILDTSGPQPATNPSLAINNVGQPIVVLQEPDATSSNIYAKRFVADAWQPLTTTPLDIVATRNADYPSLDLTSTGAPVVAWHEFNTVNSTNDIFVKRRDGSTWTALGAALDRAVARDASYPSLKINSSGNPIVAWRELNAANTVYDILVKRWDSTTSTWSFLGTTLNVAGSADSSNGPSLGLDSAGIPLVAWGEQDGNIYVKKWDEATSTWTQLGTTLDNNVNDYAYNPSLAVDSGGNPVVAWSEFTTSNYNIYVKRWEGTAWVTLGSTLDKLVSNDADNASIALTSTGEPIVAWREYVGSDYNIYVKRWNGTTWLSVGSGPVDKIAIRNADTPSLTLDSLNNPVVAWTEYSGYNGYVKRWNGSGWLSIGDKFNRKSGAFALNPSIKVNSSGEFIVAWNDYFSNYDIQVSKY
jgi:hypothetical protein